MSEQDFAAAFNASNAGFAQAMNLRYVTATAEEVIVEWTIAQQHLQPYGIVHGGVHCGVVETVCSIGAGVAARARGHQGGVVGLENHTSFIRGVRAGTALRARAVPVTRGRTTQVWEAKITDTDGKLVAQGTVRLLCVADGVIPGPGGA